MPTFNWPKQAMASGEVRNSSEVIVPAGLVTASIALTMNAAEIRDPTTDVSGWLEFFDDVELGDWRPIAFTRLKGDPSNPTTAPVVNINAMVLAKITGKRLRGHITAVSAGSYGGTLSWA